MIEQDKRRVGWFHWVMLACIDYLDEIGCIRKIAVPDARTQDVVLILRREPA